MIFQRSYSPELDSAAAAKPSETDGNDSRRCLLETASDDDAIIIADVRRKQVALQPSVHALEPKERPRSLSAISPSLLVALSDFAFRLPSAAE
jgi:hypothetical protein